MLLCGLVKRRQADKTSQIQGQVQDFRKGSLSRFVVIVLI